MSIKKIFPWIIPFFLFFFSLGIKLYDLQATEIYPDEITWTVRSKEAFLALKTKNLAYFKEAWWNNHRDTEAINLTTSILSGTFIFFLAQNQPTHYSLEIMPDYLAGRIPVVLLSSVFLVIYYFIAKRIFKNTAISLLSSFLLLTDPTSLALSRWQLGDYPLTIWLFLSLSLYFLIENRMLSVFLSSVFLALAFLTKPSAIILLVIFVIFSPLKGMITLIIFFVITNFLWLGSDKNIILRVWEYLITQTHLAQKPFTTFFFGKVTENPPFFYYIFQITNKLPLTAILGLLCFPFLILKKKIFFNKKILYLAVPLFIFIYLFIFSVSTKKLGIRYIFPIIPWLYLYSTFSIYHLINKLNQRGKILAYFSIALYSFFLSFYYFPNYYLYHNYIFGNTKKIQEKDLVGLCMGTKQAIKFLSEKYPNITSVAYLGCEKTTIPYYSHINKITTDWKNEKIVIIEESFKTLSPEDEGVKFFANKNPTFVNSWKGIILSRIYLNEDLKPK